MKLTLAPIAMDHPSAGHLPQELAAVATRPELTEPPATPLSATTTRVEAPYTLDAREALEEQAAERSVQALPTVGTTPEATPGGNWRTNALREAFQKIGTLYRWGGEQPGGFDCSGFVKYVMRHQGHELPRTAREMRATTRPIAYSDLKPGDLIFFQRPDHVGIYAGDGLFVHASSGRGRVTVSSLEGTYYEKRYAGSGRIAE